MAYDYGLLSMNNGLFWAEVGHHFRPVGVPRRRVVVIESKRFPGTSRNPKASYW